VTLYRDPLLAYLRRRHGLRPEAAEEMLQAFVADRVVAGCLAARADRGRGRFRTLLLVALDRQVVDQYRRTRQARLTVKAVGPAAVEALPCPDAERVCRATERAWAEQTVRAAVASAAAYCRRTRRGDVWLVLEQRLVLPALDGLPPPGNAELAGRLQITPTAVSNLLVTAKRLLARELRAAVGRYASTEEVDAEIRELWAAFANRRSLRTTRSMPRQRPTAAPAS
jgi:hypothetical protein